ncbi:MAG: hypothetical protein ACP5NX_02965 [Candidatus Bilamarchaeaceae archaeon]
MTEGPIDSVDPVADAARKQYTELAMQVCDKCFFPDAQNRDTRQLHMNVRMEQWETTITVKNTETYIHKNQNGAEAEDRKKRISPIGVARDNEEELKLILEFEFARHAKTLIGDRLRGITTGISVSVDMNQCRIRNITDGMEYQMKLTYNITISFDRS